MGYKDNSIHYEDMIRFAENHPNGTCLYEFADEFGYLSDGEYRDSMNRAVRSRKMKIHGFYVYPKAFNLSSSSNNSRLHDADVRRIKEMLLEGYSQPRLARIFNVDESTVSRIFTGSIWKDE